jgi:hypothetical protein
MRVSQAGALQPAIASGSHRTGPGLSWGRHQFEADLDKVFDFSVYAPTYPKDANIPNLPGRRSLMLSSWVPCANSPAYGSRAILLPQALQAVKHNALMDCQGFQAGVCEIFAAWA